MDPLLGALLVNTATNIISGIGRHNARKDYQEALAEDNDRVARNNAAAYKAYQDYLAGNTQSYLDYLAQFKAAQKAKVRAHQQASQMMLGGIPTIRSGAKAYLKAGRRVMPLKTAAFSEGMLGLGKLMGEYFSDSSMKKAQLPSGTFSSMKMPYLNPVNK